MFPYLQAASCSNIRGQTIKRRMEPKPYAREGESWFGQPRGLNRTDTALSRARHRRLGPLAFGDAISIGDHMGSWDKVAHLFDTSLEDVPPQVEDNLRVAWPILTRQLTDNIDPSCADRIMILDFGCGPGGLARSLASLGFEVLGLDISSGMIARAEQHRNKLTTFLIGSFQDLPTTASFHGIVASMSFQFVPDLEACL